MQKLLWKPSEERIKNTNLYRFIQFINSRYNKKFNDYESLYSWSIEYTPDFWEALWEFADIKTSSPYSEIIDDIDKMPGAKWFSGAKLNFAENLLRFRDDEVALIFKGEGRDVRKVTYRTLYDEVARVAASLRSMGIKKEDRVVGFMPNMPETIITMLAATSIGAIWSSCSPDFGIKGVLDRFGQIRPKVIVTADGYLFKGKQFDSLKPISNIIKQLDSIEKVIVVPYVESDPDIKNVPNAILFDNFKSEETGLEIKFEQLPFDHPVYIMYSSGTTGVPKCMVQSAGGILVHHLKELILHTDLKREDNIFYFTTCGWMMWNWLTSSLGVGASLVLYDGNPFHPDPGTLFQLAQDEKITVFGTSAGYIAALMNTKIKPGKDYDLSSMKTLLSTGSPLSNEGFEFIYNEVKKDLQLSSISGGSDLNGCFALGNPIGPVYSGELQCRGLAMKVEAFNDKGNPVLNEQGELVCTKPFPSMPIYFWNDKDNKKYNNAYFNVYKNIWRHGDYIEINDRGGVIIYGRSDATLNPGGVRIGTAEIYRQVDHFNEIEDSLVIGQNWEKDVRVILFVKMSEDIELNDSLITKIKTAIRTHTSPRHVPAKVIAVPDIPYTLNMKKVEIAVKKIVHGISVTNQDALSNPGSLKFYENIKELRED